ncbi:choline transporter-like protein 1, partial [Harpegnathos saltator]|uniref:choline transporter-like protein 1 n=1 Tax=Harpegnathos saltator TaxID=610380 RepID=UPI000DBED1D8
MESLLEETGASGRATGSPKADQEEEQQLDRTEEPADPTSPEMGCCGCADEPSSKVEPTTPENQGSPSSYSQPIFVKDRSCTDVLAVIVLLALAGGFAFMMTNVVKKGDIFRVINGYDDCGNVCGRVTPAESDPRFSCKGGNMVDRRYLDVEMETTGVKKRTCVAKCNEMSNTTMLFLNRCVHKHVTDTINKIIRNLGLDSFYREAVNDLGVAWRELVYLLLIALAFSLAILVAFRYMVQWIIYIVLIGVIIACIGGTTFLWLAWYQENKAVKENAIPAEDSSVEPYFIYAIIMSVVTAITLLVVLVMRKRIALVMQLFREAGKAVCAMPALLFQPIYTYLLIGLTVTAWVYCTLWIESAGDIYKNSKGHIHF